MDKENRNKFNNLIAGFLIRVISAVFILFIVIFSAYNFFITENDIISREGVDLGDGFIMKVCDLRGVFGNPRDITLCLRDTGSVPRSSLPPRITNEITENGLQMNWKDSFNESHIQKKYLNADYHFDISEKPSLEVKIHFYPTWISDREMPPDNKFFVGFGNYKASIAYGMTFWGELRRIMNSLLFSFAACFLLFNLSKRIRAVIDPSGIFSGPLHNRTTTKKTIDNNIKKDMGQQNLVNQSESREIIISQWNPSSIALELSKLQDNPKMLKKFVDSVKARFVINQDSKTQVIRTAWLRTQLEQIKLANEMADQAITANLKNKEYQEKALAKELEIQRLTKQLEDENDEAVRQLDKEDKRLEKEVSIAEKKAKIREFSKTEPPPQDISSNDKIKLKIIKLEEDINRIKSNRDRKISEEEDEDERRRIENRYNELIDEKQTELIKLEGKL